MPPPPGVLLRRLFSAMPRSRIAAKVCRVYLEVARGDGDYDMSRNGELRLVRQVLPRARVAFDVGANEGEWTRHAVDVNPSLVVHAFEPSSATFSRLRANVPASVACNNFGLSDAPARVELHKYGSDGGTDSIYRRSEIEAVRPATATESITLETLDGYCESRGIGHIDFLKIDVEGHELAVLRGARRMLGGGAVDLVQLEYGGAWIDSGVLLRQVFEFFAPLRYSAFKVFPRRLEPVAAYHPRYETFALSTWVFARPGCEPR